MNKDFIKYLENIDRDYVNKFLCDEAKESFKSSFDSGMQGYEYRIYIEEGYGLCFCGPLDKSSYFISDDDLYSECLFKFDASDSLEHEIITDSELKDLSNEERDILLCYLEKHYGKVEIDDENDYFEDVIYKYYKEYGLFSDVIFKKVFEEKYEKIKDELLDMYWYDYSEVIIDEIMYRINDLICG